MPKGFRWKLIFILIVLGVSIWYAHPLEKTINLGLDLQGGMHLVLGVDSDKTVDSTLNRITSDINGLLAQKNIPAESVNKEGNRIIIKPKTKDDQTSIEKIIGNEYPNLDKKVSDNRIELSLTAKEIKQIKDQAVLQAQETIRNRVDEFGVAEPTIQRQGESHILIQLPGIKDIERAKQLIGKTALLGFKIVDDDADIQKALKGEIPQGDIIAYQKIVDKESGKTERIPYLLRDKALMTGDAVAYAQVSYSCGDKTPPCISLTLNSQGARLFERVTAENVNKRLAIILDGNVYSAPVINERISGGKALITGSFSDAEAVDLAIVLRAGALPAPVHILEDRTVGPSLGKDSIQKGVTSAIIGGILVVIFMLIYYKLSGVIANIALALNIIILLGAMAGLGATLTLPGIAGIALTIGMAVDANVLVYERIREELRHGRTPRAAVGMGFDRAFVTIFDSNLTTLITAFVLYLFGTGPVRGFAVTLIIGLSANFFTAVFVSRFIFDLILSRREVKKISI
ncbi:MAG: protein translocase subunit SecD [Nitrospirota bacterium]